MGNPVRQTETEDVFMKDEGLVHEFAVTGRKIGTTAELREFLGKLAHNEDLFREEMNRVLGRIGMTDAERLAIEILGLGNVLGYRDVCRVQKVSPPEVEPMMTFSEDTLREYAEANAKGEANWRLGYVTGCSLRQEFKTMGWNRKKQPCFHPEWTWWLDRVQDSWATIPVESGYRLFDFTKRFTSMLWGDQKTAIIKLGTNFERAEEQAVAEFCFSNFLLNDGERLLKGWYHWGKLQAACGVRVCVGSFDQRGFVVYDWDDYPHDSLGVVLARKS